EEPVILWTWDEARQAPVPRQVLPAEANTILGLKFAREALRLDPKAHSPRVAQLSLALEKAAGQASPDAVPAQDPATFAAATAAGPGVVGEALNPALADGKNSLAGVAALALAKVSDRRALGLGSRPHPLVKALVSPGRRVQFTAARALVDLAPDR